ncbi:unnamed protein product [Rhizopus stolonifer]
MTKETQNVQVALRIRPLTDLDRAQPRFRHVSSEDVLKPQEKTVQVVSQNKQFTFDHVFGTKSKQEDIFNRVGEPMIRKFMDGYNTTFIAYGQTSSGKTYTMGTSSINQQGIVPSAMSLLFELLPKHQSLIISFIEIYNEEVHDLLNQNQPVTIREDGKGKIHWTGAEKLPVKNLHDVLHYLDQGLKNRATDITDMNQSSSRSHAIFSVQLLSHKKLQSKLHFVDLAGSERVRWLKRTTTEDEDRRKEGIHINTGLLALGNVISSLASDKHHIPYRDSKLTRLLQDSLGGNAITLMIACVSPVVQHLQETLNTLQYAARSRTIKNRLEEKPKEEGNDGFMDYFAVIEPIINEYEGVVLDLNNQLAAKQQTLQGAEDKLWMAQKCQEEKEREIRRKDLELIQELQATLVKFKQSDEEKQQKIWYLESRLDAGEAEKAQWKACLKDLEDGFEAKEGANDELVRELASARSSQALTSKELERVQATLALVEKELALVTNEKEMLRRENEREYEKLKRANKEEVMLQRKENEQERLRKENEMMILKRMSEQEILKIKTEQERLKRENEQERLKTRNEQERNQLLQAALDRHQEKIEPDSFSSDSSNTSNTSISQDRRNSSSSSTQGEEEMTIKEQYADYIQQITLLQRELEQREKTEREQEKEVAKLREELNEAKIRLNESNMSFYSCQDHLSDSLLLKPKSESLIARSESLIARSESLIARSDSAIVKPKGFLEHSQDYMIHCKQVAEREPGRYQILDSLMMDLSRLEAGKLLIKQDKECQTESGPEQQMLDIVTPKEEEEEERNRYQMIIKTIQANYETMSDEVWMDYVRRLIKDMNSSQDYTTDQSLIIHAHLLEEYKVKLKKAEMINARLIKKKKKFFCC